MLDTHITSPLREWSTPYLQDDFLETISSSKWTKTTTDSGTILTGDGPSGIATILPSDGSVGDNDEAYLASTNQLYKFQLDKPIYGKFRLQYSEGDVNHLNVIFGFQSSVGANSLIDDGGGPRASGCQACIYKVDGGTTWRVQARNGTEYMDTISNFTAGGADYHDFEIFVHRQGSARVEIVYQMDGLSLKDSTFNKPIVHRLLVDSAVNMSAMVGAKNGETVTVETILLDKVYSHQLR